MRKSTLLSRPVCVQQYRKKSLKRTSKVISQQDLQNCLQNSKIQMPTLTWQNLSLMSTNSRRNQVSAVHLQNNRSAGTDKLKTESLKYNSSNKLITCLLMLISLILTTLSVLKIWRHAEITSIFLRMGIRVVASP